MHQLINENYYIPDRKTYFKHERRIYARPNSLPYSSLRAPPECARNGYYVPANETAKLGPIFLPRSHPS